MGNGLRKLGPCFGDDAGEISRGRYGSGTDISQHSDEGLGHSYCYIPPELSGKSAETGGLRHRAFRTISGAAISANTSTPLSTEVFSAATLDKPSAFESSKFFSSIPLQPIPRNSVPTVNSGPILRNPTQQSSGPIERGFLSGPIERSFISGPLDNQIDQLQRYIPPKSKERRSLFKNLKNVTPKSIWRLSKEHNTSSASNSGTSSSTIMTTSSETSLAVDDNDDVGNTESFLQWAQGKAGEDRVHIVISQEHGWVFVGIYDGFNGPDATHFLSNNLYTNVHAELKGLLWSEENDSSSSSSSSFPVNHSAVLKALSEGLRKTEQSYLDVTDLMLTENPELALMGSCVLVMVLKGADVYLMNVGDSRAVLAHNRRKDLQKKMIKVNEEESLYGYEYENVHSLISSQLTMDHSTCVKEEVRRIRNAHPDDPCAITNHRVKGSLKVTRAFGAGFLKHPKWNDALLDTFRVDYVGNSPYVTCSPSMFHNRLVIPEDKFLILSSDGLYQYFTNQEAVSEVETFMSTFPEGDPAQHLVEEVLFRAAKKAGMNFYELLDIPQGDRRRYHDDVSIIIISFQGRIWRSYV